MGEYAARVVRQRQAMKPPGRHTCTHPKREGRRQRAAQRLAAWASLSDMQKRGIMRTNSAAAAMQIQAEKDRLTAWRWANPIPASVIAATPRLQRLHG